MSKVAIALVVGLILCIPIHMTAAPDWSVTVVDGNGLPVAGVTIREININYTFVSQGHENNRITDALGRAHFAHVREWHLLGRGIAGTFSSVLAGIHASFGTHASVFAFGKGEGSAIRDGYVEDWTGSPEVYAYKIVVH